MVIIVMIKFKSADELSILILYTFASLFPPLPFAAIMNFVGNPKCHVVHLVESSQEDPGSLLSPLGILFLTVQKYKRPTNVAAMHAFARIRSTHIDQRTAVKTGVQEVRWGEMVSVIIFKDTQRISVEVYDSVNGNILVGIAGTEMWMATTSLLASKLVPGVQYSALSQ